LEPREGNSAYFELATPARGPGGSLFTSVALEGVRAGGSEPSGSAATRLCGVCFFDGKLPDGASSASFARIRGEPERLGADKQASGFGRVDGERKEEEEEEEEEDLWTDQETLALFEALEAHGRDDWTAVANRVGTKTAEQCVKRFVRFPVEDAFVEDLAAGAGGAGSTSADPESHAAAPFGLLSDAADAPFADAANPVMSLVAFLATCVGPRVAAAAARAALRTLAELSGGGDEEEDGEGPAGGKEEGAKNGVSEKGSALGAKTPAPAVSREHERAAAAAGLAAAAVKAKLLADRDEHEIEKLVVGVVEMQMRKIELKLRQCEELDAGLTREREALERQTARANAERKAAKRAAEEEARRLAAFRAQAEADAAAIAAKRAETEAARKAAEEARIASVPPEPRGGE
jgi:SWI/SNF related-matrix-associated actin-dependent regulator of chromatin subfamily C